MHDRAPVAAAAAVVAAPNSGDVVSRRPAADETRSDDKSTAQPSRPAGERGMRRVLRENGLSLAVLSLFLVTVLGQIGTGLLVYNQEQRTHGERPVGLVAYLGSGHFIEATAENWESEFLQMGMFIILTVFLRQKGSAESKKLDGEEDVDDDPRHHTHDADAPWPVRKGGLILWLYSRSLFIAFMLLFLISFFAHAWGGAREYSEEQVAHGEAPVRLIQFMGTSEFWFQSFQNWQSEFLSIAAMVIFTIWLRQQGSPESKPVHWPHAKTASE